jgi:hypothetical protein
MGTHDLRSTPVSPLYPGIEIHATVIDNILTQDFITMPKGYFQIVRGTAGDRRDAKGTGTVEAWRGRKEADSAFQRHRRVYNQQCVRVYELVAESRAANPKEQEQALKDDADGYAACCEKHWDDALGLFGRSLEMRPNDGPSKAMAERCRFDRESPPPEGWDCVYKPGTK